MNETDDRKWWTKELARYRPLNAMAEKLGLPSGTEIVSIYLYSMPWEEWGMNVQGDEEHSEGARLEFQVGYLIDGKSDFQLNPFRATFSGEDAITKSDAVMEFLLEEIAKVQP